MSELNFQFPFVAYWLSPLDLSFFSLTQRFLHVLYLFFFFFADFYQQYYFDCS